jgi:hypothetical protein
MAHYNIGAAVVIAMPVARCSHGVIESRNGEYYLVRLRNGVLVERYQNELTLKSKREQKEHDLRSARFETAMAEMATLKQERSSESK